MNPLIQTVIGSLVRLALGGAVGWLIAHGIMQPGQEAAFYSAIISAVAAVVWAVWNNVTRRRLLNTAAALPPGPVADAVDSLKSGLFAAATTPQDVRPVILGNGGRP